MLNEYPGGWPSEREDSDLALVLDYPRAALVDPAPGGLARLMRAVEAVQED